MNALAARIFSLLARGVPSSPPALDGFVDSLVQKFENCRSGLTDEVLRGKPAGVEEFFTGLYEEELPRLRNTIREQEPHLSRAAREELVRKVDDLIRKVVLPGYVSHARRFTTRERNSFFLLPEGFHGLERVWWAALGMLLGFLVIEATFIPLTAKEWVLPFTIGGLVFPNLRRLVAFRQYEGELNQLVWRADREISRADEAYLTSAEAVRDREEAEELRDGAKARDIRAEDVTTEAKTVEAGESSQLEPRRFPAAAARVETKREGD